VAIEIPVTGPTTPGTEAIENAMLRIMDETGYSSATLAVARNGKLVMSRGYGWQDINKTVAINPSTRMRIASIDKCFGNAVAKTLIRESAIDPNTPVFRFLGVQPYNGRVVDRRVYGITLQHLMDHKLGWDATHDGFAGETERQVRSTFRTDSPTMAQYNSFMVTQALQFSPGQESVYSNYGSVLQRRVVEKAGNRPYLDYLASLCEKIDVEIHPSLPLSTRGFHEIHYRPETPSYFDCFTISAQDLCKFFHHYWISGEPRDGNGYVFAFYGSLPGTTSVIRQRPDGITFAVLFNERDKVTNEEVDKQIDAAIDLIQEWPDVDLFQSLEKRRNKRRSSEIVRDDETHMVQGRSSNRESEVVSEYPFRTWADDSGEHQVEARFVKIEKTVLWLEKHDGNIIKVPIKRISDEDRRWVESQ
jgi:N-acyl-D-amino-acid deacylase